MDSEVFEQAVREFGPIQAEIFQRLIDDSRTKNVWRQLQRKRRSDQTPLYPINAPELLIREVMKITKERAYVIPRRVANRARDHYLQMAALLKKDAERFADFPEYGLTYAERAIFLR